MKEPEEEQYAALGELVFVSYRPNELKVGMYFINKIQIGVIEPQIEVYQLDHVPEDMDEYMTNHGAPVKFLILSVDDSDILAHSDQIGWFDDESEEHLVLVTTEHLNTIINEHKGYCWVDIDDGESARLARDEKVVISYPEPEDYEDESED